MADATSNLNTDKTPCMAYLGFELNSTQDDYYNGTMLQENGLSEEEAVSAGTTVDGKYLGLCSERYSYSDSSVPSRFGRVNIEPHIRTGVTITGASTSTKGQAVYATDDQTLTLTYATGAKFVGISWIYDGAYCLLDIGFLNRLAVSLAGGNSFRRQVFAGLAASFTASNALNIPITADSDCVIKTITVTNTVVLSSGTDFTMTFKKNATGSALTVDDGQVDTVTQDAVHTVTFATPVVLARGDTLNLYVSTVSAAATTGSLLVEAVGYNV